MPKYRLLQDEELEALEKEFIDYLVVNGITADDWKEIKVKDNQKAKDIIALFSDVVFEKIMRQSSFIEHQTDDSFFCFHYQSKEAILLGIKNKNGSLVLNSDLSQKIKKGEYEVLKGKKRYTKTREQELFDMIQKGAQITDGTWFKKFATLI